MISSSDSLSYVGKDEKPSEKIATQQRQSSEPPSTNAGANNQQKRSPMPDGSARDKKSDANPPLTGGFSDCHFKDLQNCNHDRTFLLWRPMTLPFQTYCSDDNFTETGFLDRLHQVVRLAEARFKAARELEKTARRHVEGDHTSNYVVQVVKWEKTVAEKSRLEGVHASMLDLYRQHCKRVAAVKAFRRQCEKVMN